MKMYIVGILLSTIALVVLVTDGQLSLKEKCQVYSMGLIQGSWSARLKVKRADGLAEVYAEILRHPADIFPIDFNQALEAGFDAGFTKGLPKRYATTPLLMLTDIMTDDCVAEGWLAIPKPTEHAASGE